MSRRLVLFLILMALHGLAIAYSPEWLAPWVAATIYGPLMLLQQLNLPVFGLAASGGWAAPSFIAWAILVLFWGLIWFAVASLMARYLKKWARIG